MAQQLVTNFLGGQVSATVRGRADTALYRIAALEMRNVFLNATGAAETRPGTINRATAGAANEPEVRLEPVILRRNLVFMIAMEPARLKIYSVVGAAVTLEATFVAPWDANSMWTATYHRVGRVVFFADNNFWPQQLEFAADGSSFTLADFNFQTNSDASLAQPMHKLAPEEMTIQIDKSSGTGATITTSAAWWDASYVGREIEIWEGRVTITGYTSTTVLTGDITKTIQATLGLDPFQKKEGLTTIVTVQWINHGLTAGQSVTISGAGVVTGVATADINKTHTVGTIVDEDHFEIPVSTSGITIDFGGAGVKITALNTPTRRWKEQVFYDGNTPQAVTRHQNRLFFGGTPAIGDDRWGSASNNLFNFGEGTGADDEAIKALGDTASFNIRHMVSGENLEIYGDTQMAVMDSRDAIAPNNKISKLVRGTAGAAFTRPVLHDGSWLFVDALGNHVRELTSIPDSDAQYTVAPVTSAIPEIINQPLHSASFEGSVQNATPYSIWTNSDGTLAIFIASRSENVAAWFTLDTPGTIHSVCGLGERLFLAVEREGSTFIEEVDFSGIVRCDWAKNVTAGSPQTAWTAPAEFWGSTVDVFNATGDYVGQFAVNPNDGSFTTQIALDDIWIGLPASWRVELLPIIADRTGGRLTMGLRERIRRIAVQLYDTIALRVQGVRVSKPDDTNLENPPVPINGAREVRKMGWQRNPSFYADGSIAERASILSVLMEIS